MPSCFASAAAMRTIASPSSGRGAYPLCAEALGGEGARRHALVLRKRGGHAHDRLAVLGPGGPYLEISHRHLGTRQRKRAAPERRPPIVQRPRVRLFPGPLGARQSVADRLRSRYTSASSRRRIASPMPPVLTGVAPGPAMSPVRTPASSTSATALPIRGSEGHTSE